MRPIHPGEFIADELEELGLTIDEMAGQIGVPASYIARVIAGQDPLSTELALRLGRFLGNGPDFWLALQTDYDRTRLAEDLERIPAHA